MEPFPAGGAADMIARELARQLGKRFNIPVIVENKVGASGIIGSQTVARSAPDGGTLLVTATFHAINPSLYKELPYDTRKDFTSLALLATSASALAVNPKAPINSIKDLIASAKKEPGKLTYGSTGVGGGNHLAGELFALMANIKLKHVPYPGSPQAMTAVLGGHIVAIVNSLPTILPYVPDGRLRVLGVTSKERHPSLPDVPTIDEAGVPGFEALSWFGLWGPANMTPELRDMLQKAVADSRVPGTTRVL